MDLLLLFVGAILVNNVVLARFLGVCPLLGVSQKVETAFGMGVAVTFVMAIASVITNLVYSLILAPMKIEYLYTLAFILVIASLVQFVEMVIQKTSPSLYAALGVYLPLITTNCAVLGIAIINMQEEFTLIESVTHGVGAAIGFMIAIVLFAGIRERIDKNNVPEALKGFPIALVTAGFMATAFLGFQGLI